MIMLSIHNYRNILIAYLHIYRAYRVVQFTNNVVSEVVVWDVVIHYLYEV